MGLEEAAYLQHALWLSVAQYKYISFIHPVQKHEVPQARCIQQPARVRNQANNQLAAQVVLLLPRAERRAF
jgi:hypothetical protein